MSFSQDLDQQREHVMQLVRHASASWAEAMRAHKLAPPDIGFARRLAMLSEAAATEQLAWEQAHTAGLLWRPVPGAENAEPPSSSRESEMRQLAEVSHQRGMTRTGWIVALVRSRLGSPVQHSPDEHAALRAVVRELNRIGGNINQIARAANTSVLQGRAVEPDLSAIQEAKLVVDKALAQLRNALDGNADYWDGRQ